MQTCCPYQRVFFRAMTVTACLAVVAAVTLGWGRWDLTMADEQAASQPHLIHNVFFTLKQDSPDARQKLIDDCYKYLKDHPGVIMFAAGPLVEELNRPVNDRDFHVGLHVGFESKAAHDVYQTAADHLKFIEENKATWETVRVFDTYGNIVR